MKLLMEIFSKAPLMDSCTTAKVSFRTDEALCSKKSISTIRQNRTYIKAESLADICTTRIVSFKTSETVCPRKTLGRVTSVDYIQNKCLVYRSQPVFEQDIFRRKGISALEYFRKMVRFVQIINVFKKLISYNNKLMRDKSKLSRVETQAAIEEQLSNVIEWKGKDLTLQHSQSTGSTLQQILDIPHDQRGNKMKIQLLKYLKQLRTIQDFPLETQTQLSKVLRFESYESGRVIIKESHYPLAVYFIWYGSVYVNSKEKDVRNNGEFNVTVNILKTGDCFGERGVLYGIRHNITVITRGYVELLVVDEMDFHNVLAYSILDKTHEVIHYLSELPTLKLWNMSLLITTPKDVYVKYFKYNTIVIKYTTTNITDWIVVVKGGSCRIIVEINEDQTFTHLPYLPRSSNLVTIHEDRSHKHLKKRFLQIGTVEPGEYFGLQLLFNKPSYKIILVSRGSECVLINKQFFFKQANSETIRLLKTKTGYYPERSKLIVAIKQEIEWTRFKKNIMKQLL